MTPTPPPMSLSTPAPKPTLSSVTRAGASRYGFAGAELGTPFEGWRASLKNSDASPCSSPAGGRLLVCAAKPVALGGSYSAKNLTYRFLDGRLAQISFQSSTNAFDFATATLKRSFGEPAKIVRDNTTVQDGMTLPHVLMTWRNGRSTIRLSDPVQGGDVLSVSFTLDADAPSLTKPETTASLRRRG